jgi:Skp family chaperone for outer membrane proteins
MKTRCLFLFLLLALAQSAQSAQAAELSTFDEVRAQYQSYKDPTRVSYLYNRCAALQLNVAALLQRKGQKQGAKDFESLAQHYMVLSEANEREIDKKRGLKSKDTMKTVHRSVANVSEVYTKRMNSNFAQRGDYILGDAQLESELTECNVPNEFKKKIL